MMIELQCSNCGNRVSREPMEFWRDGWRFTGVPYCPCCIKTWKERNGKEYNEQYDEEKMKDEFYECLFNRIDNIIESNSRQFIYDNKETFGETLNEIRDKVIGIKESLGNNYQDLSDTSVSNLLDENKDNSDLIDETLDELERVIDELDDVAYDIENLEIY